MKKLTKEDVINNLNEVKNFVEEIDNEKSSKKEIKLEIKNRWTGDVIFSSRKETYKEAVKEATDDGANLSGANLSGANLSDADLSDADLSGADIDYSCWPLWCGSKDVKVDRRIAAQLATHFCALDCDDSDYIKAKKAVMKFAKTSHRADDMLEDKQKQRNSRPQGQAIQGYRGSQRNSQR